MKKGDNMKQINKKIIKIRKELQESKIKKSGKNKFAGFSYYELADFLPKLNELMEKYEVNDIVTVEENNVILSLVFNDETNVYKIPFLSEAPTPKGMQEIQHLGALLTYSKRYLYLNAFGITDGEVIDSLDNSKLTKKEVKKEVKKENNRDKLISFIKENSIEMQEIAKRYKLNATSSEEEYLNALILIKKEINAKKVGGDL